MIPPPLNPSQGLKHDWPAWGAAAWAALIGTRPLRRSSALLPASVRPGEADLLVHADRRRQAEGVLAASSHTAAAPADPGVRALKWMSRVTMVGRFEMSLEVMMPGRLSGPVASCSWCWCSLSRGRLWWPTGSSFSSSSLSTLLYLLHFCTAKHLIGSGIPPGITSLILGLVTALELDVVALPYPGQQAGGEELDGEEISGEGILQKPPRTCMIDSVAPSGGAFDASIVMSTYSGIFLQGRSS